MIYIKEMTDEILTIESDYRMSIKFLDDERIEIIEDSEEGILTITSYSSECCANVYADFESLKDQPITEDKFIKLQFRRVPDAGLSIFYWEERDDFGFYSVRKGTFLCCYNEQNGWYGDDLMLEIESGNLCVNWDLTGSTFFKED